MIKNILFGFLIALLVAPVLTAQSFNLKKEPTVSEIDTFISKIPAPTQAELNFAFAVSDLEDVPYKSPKMYQTELAEVEKKFKAKPQNLALQKDYFYKFKAAYHKDTTQIQALRSPLIGKLQKNIEENKEVAESHHYLSGIYLDIFDLDKAQFHAQQATELMPDSAKVWLSSAGIAQQMGELETAKKLYKKTLEIDDKELTGLMLYVFSDLFIKMRTLDTQGVIDLKLDKLPIEEAYKKYNTAPLETLLNASAILEIFYTDLIGVMSQLDPENEDEKMIDYFIKNISKDTRLPALRVFFEKALKKRKGNKSFLYQSLGFIDFVEGNLAETKVNFKKSIEEDPDKAINYTNLLFIYILEEDWSSAENILLQKMKAIEVTPNDYVILARIYSSLENTSKKIEALEKGLSLFSENDNLLFYRTLIYFDNQEMEKVQEFIIRTVSANQGNLDAVVMFAALQLRENNIKEALDPLYYAKMQGSSLAAELFDTYFEEE